jgi:hypothetical protein
MNTVKWVIRAATVPKTAGQPIVFPLKTTGFLIFNEIKRGID